MLYRSSWRTWGSHCQGPTLCLAIWIRIAIYIRKIRMGLHKRWWAIAKDLINIGTSHKTCRTINVTSGYVHKSGGCGWRAGPTRPLTSQLFKGIENLEGTGISRVPAGAAAGFDWIWLHYRLMADSRCLLAKETKKEKTLKTNFLLDQRKYSYTYTRADRPAAVKVLNRH